MPSLKDKLNALVRASVRGVLGDDPDRSRSRRPSSSRAPLGKELDREIAALRERIDAALDHEEHIQAEIEGLQRQIAELDQQADDALAAGDEATARHAVRQLQLQRQHLAIYEADLAQHRQSTSELISRVNELEATVAAARQEQATAEPDESGQDDSLSARLRQARQKATGQAEIPSPSRPASKAPTVDDDQVEDDLARRRARLSQPD